jgi:predicted AAA+ superfamily ATPase
LPASPPRPRPSATPQIRRQPGTAHCGMWWDPGASLANRKLTLNKQGVVRRWQTRLTHPTINTYLDYLDGAFLVRSLPAYRANLKKRLTKSPKVYWRDSGLLHAILGVHTHEELLRRPWVGASWEGFVIAQTLDTLRALGRSFQAYYFRTSDRCEIDLVLDFGRETWAVEIKLTSDPSADDWARLDKTSDMIRADRRILVTRTRRSASSRSHASLGLQEFLETLREPPPRPAARPPHRRWCRPPTASRTPRAHRP